MKILHTSDWHLGKNLEGHSRLWEQKLFLEELEQIAEDNHIDMILVAGDIYDTYNPTAAAEGLFYDAMKRLSKSGQRPVVLIAGNHDSPERLTAASPLALEQGVILLGLPKSVAPVGKFGAFEILESGEGYFKIRIREETAVILTMPYPSERRLNEMLSDTMEGEETAQKSYSERIGALFRQLERHYEEGAVHLAMGHFFTLGGEESGSERPIQLGGALTVSNIALPQKAQYIALGHLHKPQTVGGTEKRAYYSGSPLQYSKEEASYAKAVNVVTVRPGQEAKVEKILLQNHKPIDILEAFSIEEALKLCADTAERNAWTYLKIHTDRVLEQGEIKEMKSLKKDIVEIEPIFSRIEEMSHEAAQESFSRMDQFRMFYQKRRGVLPTEELEACFYELLEEEEKDDTQSIEVEGAQ